MPRVSCPTRIDILAGRPSPLCAVPLDQPGPMDPRPLSQSTSVRIVGTNISIIHCQVEKTPGLGKLDGIANRPPFAVISHVEATGRHGKGERITPTQRPNVLNSKINTLHSSPVPKTENTLAPRASQILFSSMSPPGGDPTFSVAAVDQITS